MIKISRYRKDENGRRIRPSKAWFKKAKAATNKAIRERNGHKWDTKIYANRREVRAALEKLFYEKCAYCEKHLPEIWDVEHYRPKSRVAERKEDHPGYYWLGYTWENMYPSCTSCNRRTKDKPLWDDLRELPAGGKFDHFPLSHESTRAMSHVDDISKEARLLVNPCKDNPKQYLGYDPKGQVFSIGNNPIGVKSIEVYNLRRRRLRRRRKKIIARTIKILRVLRNQKGKSNDNDPINLLKELLGEMLSNGSEYAGAARFVKRNHLIFL